MPTNNITLEGSCRIAALRARCYRWAGWLNPKLRCHGLPRWRQRRLAAEVIADDNQVNALKWRSIEDSTVSLPPPAAGDLRSQPHVKNHLPIWSASEKIPDGQRCRPPASPFTEVRRACGAIMRARRSTRSPVSTSPPPRKWAPARHVDPIPFHCGCSQLITPSMERPAFPLSIEIFSSPLP